jgi:hypothetical protein
MIRRAILSSVFAVSFSTAAMATGTVSCVSEDGASVDLSIGTLSILAVLSAHIQADGELWSTQTGEIGAVQAFGDEEKILVDFTDDAVNEVVARLRLFRVLEGNDFAMAGTLQIVGTGAYALTCTGP